MHFRKMVKNTEFVGSAEESARGSARLIRQMTVYIVIGALLGVALWEMLK
ncbi:MAG: hypothetical protein JWR22_4058 [Herminiimonas sp.]|nr:hypothetical protein [Herminiimonas sp.]